MSYPDNSMSQKLLHLTKKTFFLNSKTVVYLGCFKGIKLSLFLIFNLKYKPLFTDFSVPLGASFFLPGSVWKILMLYRGNMVSPTGSVITEIAHTSPGSEEAGSTALWKVKTNVSGWACQVKAWPGRMEGNGSLKRAWHTSPIHGATTLREGDGDRDGGDWSCRFQACCGPALPSLELFSIRTTSGGAPPIPVGWIRKSIQRE